MKFAGTLIKPVASGVSVVLSGKVTTVGVPRPAPMRMGIRVCDILLFLSVRLRRIARQHPYEASGYQRQCDRSGDRDDAIVIRAADETLAVDFADRSIDFDHLDHVGHDQVLFGRAGSGNVPPSSVITELALQ